MPGGSGALAQDQADPLATLAAASRPWQDLRLRALSVAVLARSALAGIWLGALPWVALVTLGVGGLAFEWVHLCGAAAMRWPGILVMLAVLAGCGLAATETCRLGRAAAGGGGTTLLGRRRRRWPAMAPLDELWGALRRLVRHLPDLAAR